MPWIIKRRDTAPSIRFRLLEHCDEGDPGAEPHDDGIWRRPVDLSLVETVELRIRAPHRVIVAGPVVIENIDNGECSYTWEEDDLAADNAAGTYEVEAELTYTDGRTETIPNEKARNPTVQVDDDLDPTADEIAAGGG